MRSRELIPDINYDAMVDSSKVGSKPEPKIFEVAQELASVASNELLIDNERPNHAAQQQPLASVSFDDFDPASSIAQARETLAF